jgi:hypothetical protein
MILYVAICLISTEEPNPKFDAGMCSGCKRRDFTRAQNWFGDAKNADRLVSCLLLLSSLFALALEIQ